jgi:hypothetical protein
MKAHTALEHDFVRRMPGEAGREAGAGGGERMEYLRLQRTVRTQQLQELEVTAKLDMSSYAAPLKKRSRSINLARLLAWP